jgi:aldehyde:ferredoxin oxidoreductase
LRGDVFKDMELGGYTGKILKVNLTTKKVHTEQVDMELVNDFLGGVAITLRLAYDLIPPGMDSFAENSPIIYGVGPCVGTLVPSGRTTVATYKMPLYGTIGWGHVGGDFGAMLKWAGYDFIIITGQSDRPVYLNIHDDDVQICDAIELWGKDVYTATDMIWERHDNPSVHCIGPAGERMVRTTVGLVDKVSTLGKGGLPALMGSKKLKAVAVKGTKGIKVAEPERLREIIMPIIKQVREHQDYEKVVDLGTMAGWEGWFIRQGASHHNWRTILPHDKARQFFGLDVYKQNIKGDRLSCAGCIVGCKDRVRIKEGEFAGLETYGSSFYGRLSNFSARCNVGTFNRFVKCLDYCNRMGVCVHEITALIDWAIDLYKHGIISKEDTGGLELDWNFETTWALLQQVANREGFGATLGEGYLRAIPKIGRGCEALAIHIKGGTPLYDARVNRLQATEFSEVINPRHGHPRTTIPGTYMTRDLPVDVFRKSAEGMGLSQETIERIFTSTGFNIGRLTKWAVEREIYMDAIGSSCIRMRAGLHYDASTTASIYSAVTGRELTVEEMLRVGERAHCMHKVLNLREGFTRKDDKFPDRWFEPIIDLDGKEVYLQDYFRNPLSRKDCEKILDDYYDELGWDIKLGIPTKKRLVELGLTDVAKDLKGSGYI